MTYNSPIELKNAEPLEVKDGGDIEARFEEYHSATREAIEAAEQRSDALEERLNRMMLTGVGLPSDTKSAAAVKAERSAYGRFVKAGDDTELKALSAGSDPAGGYAVDTNLSRTINQKIYDQSPMRRLSRVISLTSGDGWSEPRSFGDGVGASWIGETDSRPETDNPDLGMLTIPLSEVYATQVVTAKLLDLAYVDIGSWLESAIAEKFARTEGLAYLSGDGVGKPRGFLNYSTSSAGDDTRPIDTIQYVDSGTAATIADADGQANGLKKMVWTLRAPYRRNATWLMSSLTASSLDRLKDANKQYIWKSSNTAGAPDELFGYPVEFEESMPSEGAGLFPVAFGDISKAYTVVDWSGIKALRDPYTQKPNILMYMYRRTGGGLANSEAIKLMRCSS